MGPAGAQCVWELSDGRGQRVRVGTEELLALAERALAGGALPAYERRAQECRAFLERFPEEAARLSAGERAVVPREVWRRVRAGGEPGRGLWRLSAALAAGPARAGTGRAQAGARRAQAGARERRAQHRARALRRRGRDIRPGGRGLEQRLSGQRPRVFACGLGYGRVAGTCAGKLRSAANGRWCLPRLGLWEAGRDLCGEAPLGFRLAELVLRRREGAGWTYGTPPAARKCGHLPCAAGEARQRAAPRPIMERSRQ